MAMVVATTTQHITMIPVIRCCCPSASSLSGVSLESVLDDDEAAAAFPMVL
jgi:hypothetical protein